MRATSLLWVLALSVFASGCGALNNLSPERRLQEHVYMLNDEARWGRVDLAAMRCAPTYRAEFTARHREWGHGIRIGDADVTNIAMGDPRMSSLVTYSWIDESTMEMTESVVRQDWETEGDGFKLVGEEVLGGETGLFAAPIEEEGEASAETVAHAPSTSAGGERPRAGDSLLARRVAVGEQGERRQTRVDAQGLTIH